MRRLLQGGLSDIPLKSRQPTIAYLSSTDLARLAVRQTRTGKLDRLLKLATQCSKAGDLVSKTGWRGSIPRGCANSALLRGADAGCCSTKPVMRTHPCFETGAGVSQGIKA